MVEIVVEEGSDAAHGASREILVRRHIKPYLDAYQFQALSSERVVMWQADLHKRGRSANTQHDALRTLSTALELVRARRHVLFNVADPRQVARPSVPKPLHAPHDAVIRA